MEKIEVTKKQRKELNKLKKQLTEVFKTWHNLPDALQEKLTEASDGDSLGSCIERSSDLIDEICESIAEVN